MKSQQIPVGTNQDGVMNDVDASLVEKVWHDLDGQVSREQVGRVVTEIALRFQDAAVEAFVPIFIHRQAVERLKRLLNENRLSANGRMPFTGEQWQGNEPAAKST
jgi:hypothetical protein